MKAKRKPADLKVVTAPGGNPAFPIVGIGASAGGLEAFEELLAALPADTGMAFVLVQHLAPDHESCLSELLSKSTRLPVLEALHGMAVRPNHVYVIAPNTSMTITGGILQVAPRNPSGPHLPIDHFLRSLANDRHEGSIGVILSGAGTDGTQGLEEIKASGGITFAQTEESARFMSMPQSAARSGRVDFILSLREIARELTRIGRHPYLIPADGAGEKPAAEDEHYRKILTLLYSGTGVDFSAYRDTTIKRRIMRRMVLQTKTDLKDYAQFLEHNPDEAELLFNDILIHVTSFFRDPEVFEALQTSVFPEILKNKQPSDPVRIWIPGCSSGQEAYSLAIVLLEYLEKADKVCAIQIFATDLSDSGALQKAREGVYPDSIEAEVSPQRLKRFFSKENGKYRIGKSIRDMCAFAKHNVAADPPFSRMDLISCRNLLIYMALPLQRRIIPTFHYALNPGGFLLLGAAETVGIFTDLFDGKDEKHRIYVKKATPVRQYPHFTVDDFQTRKTAVLPGGSRPPSVAAAGEWQREADRILIGEYAPAGVLVNANLDILQFRGRTSPYLEPAPGEPSHNLVRMACEGLFPALREAVDDCGKLRTAVRKTGVRIRKNDEIREISVRVLPVRLPGQADNCFLILFEQDGSKPASPAPPADRPGDETEVARLHRDLVSAHEYLQSVIEQKDSINEEVRSANEETLSSNEELQSTNEELETAKEELQSVNEELTTVNEQLQYRNQDLSRLGDDMANLLASANIPMIVVGRDLRIRRFTPMASKLLKLKTENQGESLHAVKSSINIPDLESLLDEVAETAQLKEREVQDRDGLWRLLRIHPYRTADNKIDGAVIVLLDIDESHRIKQSLQDSSEYARAVVDTVRESLVVLNADLRVQSANLSFYRMFRLTPAETENRFLYEMGNRRWDISGLQVLLKDVLSKDKPLQDYELTHPFPSIGEKILLLNGRRIVLPGESILILLAIEDITERRREERLQAHLGAIVTSSQDAILSKTLEGIITTWNAGAERMFGYTAEEMIGQSILRLIPPELRDEEDQILEKIKTGQRIEHYETVRLAKDARRIPVSLTISPIKDAAGKIIGASKITHDISEQKRMEKDLQQYAADLRVANRRKDEFLAMLAHELRNPLAPISNALQTLKSANASPDVLLQTYEVMFRQVKLMVRLIDDLLDVSRITSGKIELHKESVELTEIVRDAVEISKPQIDAAGHELTVTLPKEPLWLEADPARVTQILGNLLNNAAKYTLENGYIWLTASRDRGEAVIEVKDTGIGIPADMLESIFDMFSQVNTSLDRAQGGLGIGLMLVKSLVTMHGGSVKAFSAGPGQGSKLTVRLPLASAPGKEKRTEPVAGSAGHQRRRILIVDDNKASANTMGWMMEALGHDVQLAYNGRDAVELAKSFLPDVVLLDIGLPGMNGYDVCRAMRQEPLLKGVTIIAQTGWGQKEHRERSLAAGFDHHLVKPVDQEVLIKLLELPSGKGK